MCAGGFVCVTVHRSESALPTANVGQVVNVKHVSGIILMLAELGLGVV